jgi:hypothetical protein
LTISPTLERTTIEWRTKEMSTIANYLTTEHKRCDDLFVDAENHVSSKAWEPAETLFAQFRDAIEQHF